MDKAVDISNKNSFISKIKSILPGLSVAVCIGFISIMLGNVVPKVGAATIAIFLGMIVGNLFLNDAKLQVGYKFSETNLLSYAIVLLGATLSVTTLMDLGAVGVIFIVLQMSMTIIGVLYIGNKLGFSDDFRYLMASGNAVCGSSAIAATAPVIGADDKDKGIVITIVNVTGIILMFILPLLTQVLYNHDTTQTSAMLGGTLQSMGQVVASGAMVNESVKDLSTVFKIVRIIFLVVVLFIFGNLKQKSSSDIQSDSTEGTNSKKIKVPWYVIGFFITCILFTFNIISADVSQTCKLISNRLEVIALAAIGLRVNVKDLIRQGSKVSLYGLFVAILQITSAVVLIGVLL